MKKILITGASGFIAKNIAEKINRADFKIIGISTSIKKLNCYDKIYKSKLGESINEILKKEKIDFIIHCAFDKNDPENKINTEGTLLWAKEAKKNNINFQILISSISARKDAVSPYGKSKYYLEKWFTLNNYISFRLGLVLGSGGMFKKIVDNIKKFPVIPIIGGNRIKIYVSEINTIADIIKFTIENSKNIETGKVYNLHQDKPIESLKFYSTIKKELNLKKILIPIPYYLAYYCFLIIKKTKILEIDFDKNNFLGLKQNSNINIKSNLKTFGYKERDVGIIIKSLKKQNKL